MRKAFHRMRPKNNFAGIIHDYRSFACLFFGILTRTG